MSTLIEQLAQQVEDLTACLESKEVDLETAAKFGSALLDENKKLQVEIGLLKDAAAAKIDGQSRLATLESAHQDLIYQLQRLEEENEKQAEVIASQQESAKRNLEQDQSLESEVKELQSQIQTLTMEKDQLSRDGDARLNHIENLDKNLTLTRNSEESLKIQVKNLEEQFASVTEEKLQAVCEVDCLKAEIEILKLKIVELEASIEEYQNFKVTAEEQLMTIEQLSIELEWLRETNVKLANKLSMTSTVDAKDGDGGGKTLLNEIEDRRLELIKEHQSLAEKHAGLAQTHSASLYRQQKMQHHISRLSQLSNNDSSQEKVRLLEEQLAQTESEKIELEKKIESMQSKSYNRSYSWEETDILNTEPIRDMARLETLEFRIQTLIEECENLKKENHKVRLVKAGETDKLHQITTLLLDKERELDETKHALANTKFELDELQLSLKESQSPTKIVEQLKEWEKENLPINPEPPQKAELVSKPSASTFKPASNNASVKTIKLDRSTVKEEFSNTIAPKNDGPEVKEVEVKVTPQPETAPVTEKAATEEAHSPKEMASGNASNDKIASSDKIASKKGKAASAKPK